MHPAYSVILFTTASGAGYGLLALLGLGAALDVEFPQTYWFPLVALGLALGLITVGLLSSTFHLGHPERAWRAFSQWRSSWLSREGVAAVATYIPAGLFGLMWLGDWDGTMTWQSLGVLSAIGAAVTVWCTGMIYGSLTTIRQWNHPLVTPVYMVLAVSTGASLFCPLMAAFGAVQPWHIVMAAGAMGGAILMKCVYWWSIDREPRVLTIEAATGLGRRGVVRQLEAPHTQENFVQREMGYSIGRKHAKKLRAVCLVGGFGLATSLQALALLAQGPLQTGLLAASIAPAAVGVIVERWLFFAQAQHVVTLFYGKHFA